MKDNFFIILVVGIVLLGSAVFLLMRFLGEDAPLLQSGNINGEPAKAVQSSNMKPAVSRVRYTGEKFVPDEVTLSQSDIDGCLLTVENASEEKLVIRLGPHNPEGDDLGFPYSLVPPGESLILDPRYRIEKISLHNHSRPGAEVLVRLDPSCILK